ncbi:MAG: hypothetical protein ACREPT_02145, partial [Rudaea sp.]
LKRRNVLRMAGLYLVGAWLVVQVSSTILQMFSAPDWLPRMRRKNRRLSRWCKRRLATACCRSRYCWRDWVSTTLR